MPILKPENDKDLLKTVEDIENLAAKASEIALQLPTDGFSEADTVQYQRLIGFIEFMRIRSKKCQEYLKDRK